MSLKVYKHGNRNINKVALTFDDGPNPFFTLKVLDILAEHNVKANFFILGKWAEKYPHIVREIFDKGHLVGNHTYSHPLFGNGDFERAEEIIFNILGTHTDFIRAPYLHTHLCRNYQPAASGEKKIIDCDVIPADFKKNSEKIKNIINQKTQNGSIILLHDSSEKEKEMTERPTAMLKALPDIIQSLKKKFQIVGLDELSF